jgi:hypothetical protein
MSNWFTEKSLSLMSDVFSSLKRQGARARGKGKGQWGVMAMGDRSDIRNNLMLWWMDLLDD